MRNTLSSRIIYVLSLFFIALPVFSAPETAPLTEEEYFADIPVVLTATRLAQPVTEAPAATTVIDREMIMASGAKNIADLFRLVPGFVVSNNDGHSPIVMYHGLSDHYSRRMQVLVDGRPVYLPSTGGVEWTDLALSIEDIERIEVIRGPNAASYGTNAFLSVINITTYHATETAGKYAKITRGTNNINDTFLRFGNIVGDFSYRLSLDYNQDEGFEAREDTRYVRLARFRSDYQVNNNDSLMLQLGLNNNTRGYYEDTLQEPTDRNTKYQFEQLQWRHQTSDIEEFGVQFFHTTTHAAEGYDKTIFPIGRVVVDNAIHTERYDLEFQHTLSLDESNEKRIVWGLGARQDSSHAVDIYGTNSATGYTGGKKVFYNNTYRGFGNLEWRFRDQLIINLGAMIENSDLIDTRYSPRLGINYLFTPEHSFRASASRATRSPTFFEAYMNYRVPVTGYQFGGAGACPGVPPCDFVSTIGTGNADLRPETITAYELGYHTNLIKHKLSFDLKFYWEELRDLIGSNRSDVTDTEDLFDLEHWTTGNFTDSDIEGVEAALEFNPFTDTRIIVSHSHIRNMESINPNVSSDDLAATVPNGITSVFAIQRFPKQVTASLLYTNVGRSNGLGTGNEIPGYARLDFRLGFEFGTKKINGEIAFVYHNLFDEYLDWRDENLFDNNRFVDLSIQWD